MPITKAGKTIIFEEFNSNKKYVNGEVPDRLDFLLSAMPNGNDIAKIESKLGVGSYEEFLRKFQPVIYEQKLGNSETGEIVFNYTLDEPPGKYSVINITEEKFYKMAVRLYDQKSTAGMDNLNFEYEDIQEVLTPKKALDEARKLRKELEYNLNEYIKLEKKAPNEAKKHVIRIKELRTEIAEKYYSGNILALVAIALDDVQKKIDFIDKSQETLAIEEKNPDGTPRLLTQCDINFDDEGKVLIKPIENLLNNQPEVKRIGTADTKLLGLIEKDFDKFGSDDMKQTNFAKELMISTFAGTGTLTVSSEDRDKFVERRDSYAKIYKASQESFAKQMIAIVEKFINVRAFFDHASTSAGTPLSQKVLIANCKISDLMADGKKDNFKEFIDILGQQNNDNKLWYAVVPALKDSDFEDFSEDENISLDDDIELFDDFDEDNQSDKDSNLSTFSEFRQFITLLKDAKIITFFNFKGNEKTGFSQFNEDIIEKYKTKCSTIDDDCKNYSVLCYPNFTLLPKEKTRTVLCKLTEETVDDNGVVYHQDKDCYLDSPSIYIDSSYIACAMMIAVHNINYLKEKGFPVSSDEGSNFPAVRFDFEGSFKNSNYHNAEVCCNKVITTKFNRENIYSNSRTDRAINNFGFCFGCNELRGADPNSRNPVKNAYVVCARTIASETNRDNNKSQYRPIYKTAVNIFIHMYFQLIRDFKTFEKDVSIWGREASQKLINNPIYRIGEGDGASDTIKVDQKDGKVRVRVDYATSEFYDDIDIDD